MQLLKLYSTNKQLFITREKVGSRYLLSAFNEPNIYQFQISNDLKSIKPGHELEVTDTVKEIIKDWQLSIDKKSKKDIVIMYRKPEEKLKSGIIQDFYSIFHEDGGNTMLVKLIFKYLNTGDDIQQFVLRNSYEIRFMDVDDLPKPVVAFYKEALTLYLDHLSSIGFRSTHCGNYLHILFPLIFGNIFDTNKLILCDIDSCNVADLFESLNIVPDKESINSNNGFKQILHEVLKENPLFRARFDSKIESEVTLYSMIKLHDKNFCKK